MTMDKKIDDEWKRQAEEEKKKVAAKAQEEAQRRQPPPASFGTLITMFATQAMVAFGGIENPITGKKEVDLPAARYAIDILGVVEEKTRGNLTEAEAASLKELIHNLKMQFVAVAKGGGEAKGDESQIWTPGSESP